MTLQSKINEAADKYGRDHEAATLNQIRLEDAVKFGAKLALSLFSEEGDRDACKIARHEMQLSGPEDSLAEHFFMRGIIHARQQERARGDRLREAVDRLLKVRAASIFIQDETHVADFFHELIEARSALDADEKEGE